MTTYLKEGFFKIEILKFTFKQLYLFIFDFILVIEVPQMLEGNEPVSFIKSIHSMYPARVLNEHWNDRNMDKDKPESLKFLIPWFISFSFYSFPVHIFWDPTFGKKLIKSVPWVWHDWT